MLRKMRPVLIVVGLALAVGSIIGASKLTGGNGTDAKAKVDAPQAKGGPIVLGLVDTDPPPVSYGLPPVLQSGTVIKVFVKDGDEVKVGQALYSFDATIPQTTVESAKATVAVALTKVDEAKELAKQHTADIAFTRDSALSTAERKVKLAQGYYNLVKDNLLKNYKIEKHPEAEWDEKLKLDNTLHKANVDYDVAVGERNVILAKLKQLEAVNPQVKVKEAEAAVKQAQAEQAKAQAAVDMCVVKAKTAGTIEQVTISEGTTLGISTRAPALWLIPAGPRVVRAEVEAEFAHRVGNDLKGKQVTIYDHTNAKLTYTGKVRHISNTFLLKRASAENFLGGDTRVIEAVIEVTDSAPTDKPRLLVGQRVRVNLGQ